MSTFNEAGTNDSIHSGVSFGEILAQYRRLTHKRSELQAKKANLQLDLQQSSLHPEWYKAEKLAEIREQYHTVNAELGDVAKQIDSLFSDFPDLRAYLEEEEKQKDWTNTEQPPVQSLETYTAAELQTMEFPPLRWAVQDLLPEGLSFLAGAPKIGKSWLALDIGLAVAAGGKALGSTDVMQGEVLYLALEDSKRRMQSRIKMLLGDDALFPAKLHITHYSPKIGDGLETAITAWLSSHKDARLIIIDTLARVRRSRSKNTDLYTDDTDIAARFQRLALDNHIAILVVHHVRKMEAEDPLEMVSGSFGLTGGADGVLVLKRSRGEADAVFSLMGRDVEEKELALSFIHGAWHLIGDAKEYALSKERRAVITFLRTLNKPTSAKDIAAALDKKYSTIRWLLANMANEGQIRVTDRGQYAI